jgi:2-polyprenyl-3-methyl-5-hydroxy-6-metoxy-1,4-benzoquinol methylase
MQLCDCVTLATYSETFGLVLAEAMRAGVAVIGSNCGGVVEIIDHKSTGLLFETRNPSSLCEQLKQLHDDPELRQQLAANGKEMADTRFSNTTHFNTLEKYITNTVSPGGTHRMVKYDDKKNNCIICNSNKIKLHLVDHNDNSIYICNDCGFQFMNPQYTDEYLNDYYSDYTNVNDNYWDESAVYGHNFYLSIMERFVKPAKLLDVGCGNGHLLTAAIKRGWNATGYDVGEESTRELSEKLGINVFSGDFLSIEFDNNYDLITLHQVMEHLKDPLPYLKKINEILKRGGYLFVAVPNIKSLSHRFKFFIEKTGLKKKRIGKYYDSSHHLLYFELSTMTKLLGSNGFKIIYSRNCHGSKPGQSSIKRFIMRNITDHLFSKSTFLVIAEKQ